MITEASALPGVQVVRGATAKDTAVSDPKDSSGGRFVPPTLLTGEAPATFPFPIRADMHMYEYCTAHLVTHLHHSTGAALLKSRLMAEEVFGPVLSVIPVDDMDQVLLYYMYMCTSIYDWVGVVCCILITMMSYSNA
jgi:hypothetical protein